MADYIPQAAYNVPLHVWCRTFGGIGNPLALSAPRSETLR